MDISTTYRRMHWVAGRPKPDVKEKNDFCLIMFMKEDVWVHSSSVMARADLR